MTALRTSPRIALAFIVSLVCLFASSVAAQDTLARAKELYLSASYDEALAVLERLQYEATGTTATEIGQYRVFCLLALDRVDDAKKAIEGVVKADPFFRPSDVDASPRVRSIFQEVRQPLLPGIAQRMYTEAKAAFDRKDPQAGAQFDRVLAILDDPDVKGTSVADLRTLAAGFRDLSKAASAAEEKAAAPPPAPAPAPPPQAPPPVLATAPPLSNPDAAREGDQGVTPPVTVSQTLPPWAPSKQADRQGDFRGTLEVTIDEQGDVEAVAMRQSVHPLYDPELLKIARSWKFKPATKNGVPVLYVKVVQIHLAPKK